MIRSRTEDAQDDANSAYLLVSAALAQILYEGGVYSIDVDLPDRGLRGRIETTMSVQGTPELRVRVD